ncbi:Ribosomal RNA large subunit methyltransferase H [uncultured Clostridium sp.]|uniref:23S rRNA (pseudouridine(1915)-N(3))-methyltransferase RlmH n=1 Tax=Eubacteriales TaxID=186802 RepID=UPI000820290D|nr:23S rRNA (pseudouridine(1915)-N(3))-methyltransferase RlmH [Muriventricola aceti]MCU6703278.1 23S rRNA (pseudouridine(1915)-N(3))-methyltransferase RlmH [Muriventricola aceti]SCH50886.1 Ribosomal RNA large subunit methyltransferase H [uncultured Clostridium sp.]SCJ41955.1 Ribosomal RNA large subunit methyltransferase H [uncultured Flavonifractor sp.]
MLSIYLVCVGRLKERFYQDACAEYLKRLSPYCKLTLLELPEERLPQTPSQGQIDAALEKEGQAIRSKLPPNTSLVCLCVEGRLRSSEELASLVQTWEHNSAKHLAFVIGGSFGLAESLKAEAWVRLSMSPMTFPHHLARVMVLEQLYRAFKINEGSNYHK